MNDGRRGRPKLSRIIETISTGAELTGSERWLLVVIASHGGGFRRESYPGYALLARLTGFEPRSVARLVASCETKNWLRVYRQEPHRPQASNRYLVTPPAEAKIALEEQERARKERATQRAERWALKRPAADAAAAPPEGGL